MRVRSMALILALLLAVTALFCLLLWETSKRQAQLEQKIEKIEEAKNIREEHLKNLITQIEIQERILEKEPQPEANISIGDWQEYEATGYTSLDTGVNNISAIGMDIERWSSYFNFVAVDPRLIPYGSVVLVELDEITPFLAVDTGGAIRGYKLDLYFVNDLQAALEFGRQNVRAKVIK